MNNLITARIAKDSYSIVNGVTCRITSCIGTLPKNLLAQFNKHREFGSNTSSSRAMPTWDLILRARNNPYFPKYQKNRAGMQSSENYSEQEYAEVLQAFDNLRNSTVDQIEQIYHKFKPHKQEINRYLEPYLTCEILFTTTSLSNFFALRTHGDTQEGFSYMAKLLLEEYKKSSPQFLGEGEWHLPLVEKEEYENLLSIKYSDICERLKEFDEKKGTSYLKTYTPERYRDFLLQDISAGRCTTISYVSLSTGKFDPIDDIRRAIGLTWSTPIHASPFEHMARPATIDEMNYKINQLKITTDSKGNLKMVPKFGEVGKNGNLTGFTQYRKLIDNEYVSDFPLN